VLVSATGGEGASVDDPAVEAAGLDLARRLAAEPAVRGVTSYWSLFHAPPLRSRDARSALILGQVLVFVFQEGHFARALRFTPTGTISVFTPVLLFCIAFGLSMDYEVFLLSRIKEEVDLGRANDDAVAVVKVFGLGLAIAVLVDAFLIRATLVPAFMRLAGRANWYAPRPLRRLHLLYGIWETEPLDIVERSSAAPAPAPVRAT